METILERADDDGRTHVPLPATIKKSLTGLLRPPTSSSDTSSPASPFSDPALRLDESATEKNDYKRAQETTQSPVDASLRSDDLCSSGLEFDRREEVVRKKEEEIWRMEVEAKRKEENAAKNAEKAKKMEARVMKKEADAKRETTSRGGEAQGGRSCEEERGGLQIGGFPSRTRGETSTERESAL